MSAKIKAHIALVLVGLLYGANYSIAKVVMDENYIQPLGFILMRVVAGAVLFWIFHQIFVREKVEKKDFSLLFLCAVFGVAINQMMFFKGLKYTTPINASLIMTTTPILVLIVSAILIKEKITAQKMVGIFFGALGAIILISHGKGISFHQNQMIGDVMIFINAISYGIYLVLVKKLMARYHPLTIVKWVFIFGIALVIPFGIGDVNAVEWSSFTSKIWWAVAYVLVGVTFLAYLLNAFALKIVNPSVVSIYIYLQPLFATIFALLLGKDEMSWVKIWSGILIFLGVYLVSQAKK
ncbi:MAG TPA: EamA/RhaT family transporter [Phaeodactylibacter sp.]|nr:EamA/RhaT family transporter [Phaeodactylibacter sp.]